MDDQLNRSRREALRDPDNTAASLRAEYEDIRAFERFVIVHEQNRLRTGLNGLLGAYMSADYWIAKNGDLLMRMARDRWHRFWTREVLETCASRLIPIGCFVILREEMSVGRGSTEEGVHVQFMAEFEEMVREA